MDTESSNNEVNRAGAGGRVLVVDDNRDFADALAEFLSLRGYQVETVESGEQARKAAEDFSPHVALLDIQLGDENGLDVLAMMRREHPDVICVMVTAYGDVDTAIEAVRQGAYDYLRKPFNNDYLLIALERCFEKLELEQAKAAAEQALEDSRTQLMDAIESILEGFVIYDSDERFVLCNSKYRDFYPQIDAELVPGAKLEDLARAAFERGAVQGSAEDVDKWLRIRVDQYRTGRGTHEQHLSDGRWLLCADRKMTDGGTVSIRTDISELKSREQALHESEQRVRGIQDNVADGVITIDAGGAIESFNPASVGLFGYEPDEVLGRDISMLMPEPDRGSHDGYLRGYLQTGKGKILGVGPREVTARRKDGSTFSMELTVGEMFLDQRRVFIGAMRDISRRKEAEVALRDSETRLANTQRIAALGSYEWDPVSDALVWSDQTYRNMGREPEEFHPTFESFLDCVHPDDRPRVAKEIEAAIDEKRSYETEFRIVRPDGEERVIRDQCEVVLSEAGEFVQLHGASHDITERKRAEEAEARLREAIDSLSEGFALFDPDDRLVLCNEKCRELFPLVAPLLRPGVTFEELVRAAAERDQYVEAVRDPEGWARRRLEAHRRADGTFEHRLADGRWLLVVEHKAPDGHTLSTYIDITERKRAEEALRESEARLRAIMDNAPFEINVKDTEGVHVLVNKESDRLYSKDGGTIVGKTSHDLHPEERAEAHLAHDGAVLESGRAIEREFEVAHDDGERVYSIIKFPIRDGAGEIRNIGAFSSDITDRKRLEEQFNQAQKMEAVGQLTGGVAHDFNNLLTVILGNLELLGAQLGDDDELRSLAFAAQNAGLRGAELTRRLLAFSRKQSLEPKIIDLDHLVLGMSGLMKRTLGQTVEIQTVTNAGQWRTLADPAQLENALLNLALNARDAMPDGGKLTIEVANLAPGFKHGVGGADLAPGDYVVLTVSDNGIGMSVDALAHAMEPFFTTKEVGKGSGLGLSMVYGFARQSGGDLVIDSAPDQGTRVMLYLPKADVKDEAEVAEEAAPDALPGGDETILVVDDDADVRALAVKILAGLGYEVIEAGSGPAALELLEGERKIDLLFSDVLMPGGMSGWMLAQRGRRIRPGLKVLLASGYPRDAVDDGNLLEQGVELLPKPYKLADLAWKTRRALEDGAPALNGGRRLLVVDDDPEIGEFVRRVAEGDGFEVKVTVLPEDFKQIYEDFRPAVIVMDIVMPEADGIELLRYLAEQGCRSRVVMMSGFNESYLRHAQSIGEGLGLAEVSSLAKPLRVETLRSALQG